MTEHKVATSVAVHNWCAVWCSCGAEFERGKGIESHIREENKKNTAVGPDPWCADCARGRYEPCAKHRRAFTASAGKDAE